MDPFTIGSLVVGGLSSMAGASAQQSARNQAAAQQRDVMNRLNNLSAPELEQLKVYLQSPEIAAQFQAELAQATQASPSEMRNIMERINPEYKEQQALALKQLSDIAKSGMTDIERAQMDELLRGTASQEKARQAQIQENMAKRGMGGSGAELAAALSSSQSAANIANQNALQIGAQALQRKMGATQNLGQLATQLQGQGYEQQAGIASAADRIAAMNAGFTQQTALANQQARQQAAQYNVANAQQVANQRAAIQNQQALQHTQANQLQFENQMRKAGLLNTASNTQTGLALEQGKQQGAMYGDIGSGIIKAGAALKDTDWKSLFGGPKELSRTSGAYDPSMEGVM